MTPAEYNFQVVRGNAGATAGLVFFLTAGDPPQNLAYDNVILSVYNRAGTELILRASLDNGHLVLLDAPTNKFAWVPTTDHTRRIPKGLAPDGLGKASYELEVWNGDTEITYMMGRIEGVGGISDDQDGTNAGDS